MEMTANKPLICLVAVNSAWYQSNPALYYLRQMVADLPCRCLIREFTVNDLPLEVLRGIVEAGPDIVCFSAYIWNRMYLQELIPQVKRLLPGTRIGVGGPEAGDGSFGLDGNDIVIEGPGESAFRELAENGFKARGGTTGRENLPLKDIPFPYVRSDRETLKGKLVYYETSRGCPFSCVYCLSAEDERNEARFDVDTPGQRKKLFRELDALVKLEPKTVKFVDRSFNVHPRLARVVWERVIGLDRACEFHFEIYPGLLNREDLEILERVPRDRIRLEVGIQTVNPAVSAACRRRSDWRKTRSMLELIRQRTNVILHTDLIAGLPGESYGSVLNSVNELASVLPHEIQLGMLKILPGTPMQAIARERGYVWQSDPPYQALSTDRLSFRQLCRLQDLARILNLYWNKGEFTTQWEGLLASHKATDILLALLKHHRRYGLPLHSMAKSKREQVFQTVVAGIYQGLSEKTSEKTEAGR
jgi:hypothetical protein